MITELTQDPSLSFLGAASTVTGSRYLLRIGTSTILVEWLSALGKPRACFVTHGEPTAADALRRRIEEQLHWNCRVPDHLQETTLR
jgi:Cft2 family RNA processing exonuclease